MKYSVFPKCKALGFADKIRSDKCPSCGRSGSPRVFDNAQDAYAAAKGEI